MMTKDLERLIEQKGRMFLLSEGVQGMWVPAPVVYAHYGEWCREIAELNKELSAFRKLGVIP